MHLFVLRLFKNVLLYVRENIEEESYTLAEKARDYK